MRTTLRPELEEIIPLRMRDRPLEHRGYPVPWFAAKLDDRFDLRVVAPEKIVKAIRFKFCWICGKPLGARFAFVIGPMCSINRISSEPPQHVECAVFAAKACPFLTRPNAERREANLPEHRDAAGIPVMHNPGACLVWVAKGFDIHRDDNGRVLFRLGDCVEHWWYCEGRTATRAEVEAAINKGLPLLREMAQQDGEAAMKQLDEMIAEAQQYLPAAAA